MGSGSSTSAWAARLGQIGRALRHRNYRLFFMGQGTSLVGSWMQRTAQAWLVYKLTGSKWDLGVVAFSGQILTFFFAPVAGVLADRVNRRWLVVATQAMELVQASILAVLTLTGAVAVWHIMALALLLGLVNAFDIPIRQSFVVEMLESREDLPNAIAMNSFLVNGSRLIGPSLAGMVIAAIGQWAGSQPSAFWRSRHVDPRFLGEGLCCALNALSFLAVIAALLAVDVKPAARPARGNRVLHNLREGVAYAFGFAPVRAILLMLVAISLLGMSYQVVFPVFARDILDGKSRPVGPASVSPTTGPTAAAPPDLGARTLGFLQAAVSIGAIIGTIFLAARSRVHGLGRILAGATATFGLGLVAFSLSRSYWLSLGLLTIVGFGAMAQMASANSLLQTIVDDDKRGRVMSFYTMCFMGMGPFGSLLVGGLASRLSAPAALAIGGAGCALAAGVFASQLPKLDKAVHPVYVRMGLAADPDAPGGAHAAPFPSSEEVRL